MKYFLILFFFTSFSLFSQNLEKLINSDVLIVYFENNKNLFEGKKYNKTKNDILTITYNYYTISNDNSKYMLSLYYRSYIDFDAQINKEKAFKLIINKSFLKKNKDIILTKRFMDKIGFDETLNLFTKADTILLIDNDDIEQNKLILKEVVFFNNNTIE